MSLQKYDKIKMPTLSLNLDTSMKTLIGVEIISINGLQRLVESINIQNFGSIESMNIQIFG